MKEATTGDPLCIVLPIEDPGAFMACPDSKHELEARKSEAANHAREEFHHFFFVASILSRQILDAKKDKATVWPTSSVMLLKNACFAGFRLGRW